MKRINETESVQVHHRVSEKNETYFLYNKTDKPIDALIEIIGEAENVTEHNLQTGPQKTGAYWHANGKTYLKCMFEAEQGRLFVVS